MRSWNNETQVVDISLLARQVLGRSYLTGDEMTKLTKCNRCNIMDAWWDIPDQCVTPKISTLASLDRINRYADHCVISIDHQPEALADDFKEILVEIGYLDKSIGCI